MGPVCLSIYGVEYFEYREVIAWQSKPFPENARGVKPDEKRQEMTSAFNDCLSNSARIRIL
ncbi:MAG: hypothetical protein ACI9SC_002739 [Gammaproteobacteria bacterium]|jgi:hypothetical protein